MFKSLQFTAHSAHKFLGTQHLRQKSRSSKLINSVINNEGVATITMHRHPVNALGFDLLTELRETLESAEKDKVRGILMTSGCKGVFSAGFDFQELYNPQPDRFKEYYTWLKEGFLKLNETGIPTVALINGHALAGGCLLSLSCDYRIMMKGYTIGMNETKLGIVIPGWVHEIMTAVMSQRQAELALTSGVILTSEGGQSVGMIDEVATDESDASKKVRIFLEQVEMAQQRPNSARKAFILKNALKNKDDDTKSFLLNIKSPAVQQAIKKFIK